MNDEIIGKTENGCELLLATVTGRSSSGVTIQLDGESTAMTKKYKMLVTGQLPAINDRVLVVKMSGTYIVLGKIAYPSS